MGTWQGINAGLQAFNQGALGLLRLDQQERENQGLAEVRKMQMQKIGNELLEYERRNKPVYLDDNHANRALIEEFPHFAEKDLAGKTFFRTENMAEARKTALSNPDIHARLWHGKYLDAENEVRPLKEMLTSGVTAEHEDYGPLVSEIEKKEAAAMEIKAQRDLLKMAAEAKSGIAKGDTWFQTPSGGWVKRGSFDEPQAGETPIDIVKAENKPESIPNEQKLFESVTGYSADQRGTPEYKKAFLSFLREKKQSITIRTGGGDSDAKELLKEQRQAALVEKRLKGKFGSLPSTNSFGQGTNYPTNRATNQPFTPQEWEAEYEKAEQEVTAKTGRKPTREVKDPLGIR